ncbi:MAG: type 4a pilus biogenesis protein PilO [Candidatus Omnitrophica bacterium]|nr:type 4a pilus biogenesis protein PilO [Candidatus Omnitrophota bacterium]MBU1922864.1 type 4a pilus biogenesis protein PilO [Candidatus Omnitrophota bacterium]
MITIDFFSKNKSKIINAGIILLAIFVALYLYSMQGQQLVSLEESKDEEAKKSEVIESLNRVEKRINSYKSTFDRKDLGSVISAMTDIAKDTRVKVISVKPGVEKQYAEYTKTSFLIVVRVADYHALGQFIGKVENYKDLFIVEDVNITIDESGIKTDKRAGRDLDISLKISTITCL